MRTIKIKTAYDMAVIILIIVTLVNFLVFTLIALHLGGAAMNGKISDGHFYLGMYSHYTEVSRQVFTYSRWHGYSVYLTFTLSFVATFLLSHGHYGKTERQGG